MTTTRNRLLALHAEAGKHHVHFETRKKRRTTVSITVNATITLSALATAAAGTAAMPTAITITLATVLLIAAILNLAVTDTEHERDLHRLGDAWRRHRTDAARLLARDGVQRPADTAEKIQHETVELECRIAETRSESLMHGLAAAPPADEQHPPPPQPANNS